MMLRGKTLEEAWKELGSFVNPDDRHRWLEEIVKQHPKVAALLKLGEGPWLNRS